MPHTFRYQLCYKYAGIISLGTSFIMYLHLIFRNIINAENFESFVPGDR